MARRSRCVGSGIITCRSNRPGRSSAGSSTSGRLVAAITTTPVAASKPSISASIWLSVWSRSSLEMTCPPRRWPIASISSMKMMLGARRRASANRSRTRAAPTPTNISTKLEPVTEMNGTPASPATARQQRLAGARRPDHQHPLGTYRTGPPVAIRLLEEVDDLADLLLGAFVASDVGEGGVRPFQVEDLRAGPPDPGETAQTGQLPPGGAARPHEQPEHDDERKQVEQHRPDRGPRRLRGDLHIVLIEQLGELGILQADRIARGEAGPVGQLAGNVAVRADRDRRDLPGADVGLQLAVAQLLRARTGRDRQKQRHSQQQPGDQQPGPPPRRRAPRGRRRPVGRRDRPGRPGTVAAGPPPSRGDHGCSSWVALSRPASQGWRHQGSRVCMASGTSALPAGWNPAHRPSAAAGCLTSPAVPRPVRPAPRCGRVAGVGR